ncbi:hypothetical protein HYV10_01125 [Candidatus Dependentiae bacterium]|nr:hypothetical protein [Candidatus Dependentiae bacterium]
MQKKFFLGAITLLSMKCYTSGKPSSDLEIVPRRVCVHQINSNTPVERNSAGLDIRMVTTAYLSESSKKAPNFSSPVNQEITHSPINRQPSQTPVRSNSKSTKTNSSYPSTTPEALVNFCGNSPLCGNNPTATSGVCCEEIKFNTARNQSNPNNSFRFISNREFKCFMQTKNTAELESFRNSPTFSITEHQHSMLDNEIRRKDPNLLDDYHSQHNNNQNAKHESLDDFLEKYLDPNLLNDLLNRK